MNEPPLIGDRQARQRLLAGSIGYTVPGTLAALGIAYALVPPLQGMADVGARLVLALRWLLVAVSPYVAVCLWITYARFVEGAHNPLLGAESERLRIHGRVMQNTLEQLVWFAIVTLALASLVSAEQARMLPVLCTLFAVARLVYWWGYLRRGTLGRAPGVQITLTLNLAVSVAAVALFVRSALAGGAP